MHVETWRPWDPGGGGMAEIIVAILIGSENAILMIHGFRWERGLDKVGNQLKTSHMTLYNLVQSSYCIKVVYRRS